MFLNNNNSKLSFSAFLINISKALGLNQSSPSKKDIYLPWEISNPLFLEYPGPLLELFLTDSSITVNPEDYKIELEVDKDKRTITITDNGCGMDEKELEVNLGTIAKSGSLAFKEEANKEAEEQNKNDKVQLENQFELSPTLVELSHLYEE